ncbi:MAG: hypothetical protein IJQ85_03200 [Selenomonadaceae bacterium]|nr:hypothetical protein [Selenomonadaceae bacterium]
MIYLKWQFGESASSRKRGGDVMDKFNWLMLALSLIQTVLALLTFLK